MGNDSVVEGSEEREREREFVFKTVVPKWPVCVMCGNWQAEFNVVCSFLAMKVSLQMCQNSSILLAFHGREAEH